MRNHRRVDRIGLGLCRAPGQTPALCRIDHDHGSSAAARRCDDGLKTAGSSIATTRGSSSCTLRQLLDTRPLRATTDSHRSDARNIQAAWQHRYRHDGVQLIPSLRKRARCAAQATVRVRWNDRRRPWLSHGLGVPRSVRSHACPAPATLTRAAIRKLQGRVSEATRVRGPHRNSELSGWSDDVSNIPASESPAERPPHP